MAEMDRLCLTNFPSDKVKALKNLAKKNKRPLSNYIQLILKRHIRTNKELLDIELNKEEQESYDSAEFIIKEKEEALSRKKKKKTKTKKKK